MPDSAQGDARTITLIVTMSIKPGHAEDFLAIAGPVIEQAQRNEPGTLLYALTRHPEREHTFVWVERYADTAAAGLHRNSPYLAEALPRVRELLADPPELLRLQQVLPA